MINAAVLGSPISHSLSPRIHRKAFEILGIPGNYQAFEVTEPAFETFLSTHKPTEWNGFSLTMPLKEAVFGSISGISEISPSAKNIKSVNTIYRKNENWAATSTDLLAFNNLLKLQRSSRVAIIGAGGTARAALGSLDGRVDSVDVLLRNPERKIAMNNSAPGIRVEFKDMNAPINEYDVVIQTTPAGAFDSYAGALISPSGLLLEALYKPSPTPLSAKYLSANLPIITGKELLVEQALYQIELFTECELDFDSMRTALLAEITSA